MAGYLQGHYGQDDAGQNVFYGKWINLSGQFEGLLRGVWGHRDVSITDQAGQHRPTGWFAGRVFNANSDPIGVLGGHFGSAPDYRGGWFQGRWKLICDETTETARGLETLNDGLTGGGRL